MSLLRLLTTGKSLVGVSGEDSRYRLTSQRLLPQFGPARNPFSSRAKMEPAPAEARPPEAHGGIGASTASSGQPDFKPEHAAVLRRAVAPRAGSAKLDARKLAGAFWRRGVALLTGWQAKLRGLLARSGGKASKPAIPRFPKPPVQGELSLDRIKVVRNDLSDADLELVPAKLPAAPAATAPAPRAVEEPAGAKSAWGRVTTRILGAGKT
jgi:hypothetical protein